FRSREKNSGTRKLPCQISTAYRSALGRSVFVQARPFNFLLWCFASLAAARVSPGNSSKKDRNFSSFQRSLGGNCHKIGPSFSRKQRIPDAKKFANGI